MDPFLVGVLSFAIVQCFLLLKAHITLIRMHTRYRGSMRATSLGAGQLLQHAPHQFLRVEVRRGAKLVSLESSAPFDLFLYEETQDARETTFILVISDQPQQTKNGTWKSLLPITDVGIYHIWLGRSRDAPKVKMTVVPLPNKDSGPGNGPTVLQET